MLRTKIKYELKRAKTQNFDKQELKFMCTALPLDEIYPPTKFHNHSKYSFGDMHQTKFKYESKPRAITTKISEQELGFMCKLKYENKQRTIIKKISKQELWFMCTALPFDEIYPPTKFYNHS